MQYIVNQYLSSSSLRKLSSPNSSWALEVVLVEEQLDILSSNPTRAFCIPLYLKFMWKICCSLILTKIAIKALNPKSNNEMVKNLSEQTLTGTEFKKIQQVVCTLLDIPEQKAGHFGPVWIGQLLSWVKF